MEPIKFFIATIAFLQALCFDTEHWHTSTDGTKAMCHEKFARTFVDVDNNTNVQKFNIDSDEFTEESTEMQIS